MVCLLAVLGFSIVGCDFGGVTYEQETGGCTQKVLATNVNYVANNRKSTVNMIIKNESNDDVCFGSEYTLYTCRKNTLRAVDRKEMWSHNEMLYTISPYEERQYSIELSKMYDKLHPGEYVIEIQLKSEEMQQIGVLYCKFRVE